MNYQGAFECDNCPMNSDPAKGRACPMWWETIWQKAAVSGVDTKVVKACGYTQLPEFLVEVVKAANRPTAQMSEVQNEIAAGLQKISGNVLEGFQKMIEAKDG